MTAAIVVLAALFGAADQYLGSWPGHAWATDASLLAAPWLVLPFVVGCTQRVARRAAILATLATFAALAGYLAMTLSPWEGATVSYAGTIGLLRGQVRWLVLGGLSSPVLGRLACRWRAGTALWTPVAPAAALIGEPFARMAIGLPIRTPMVGWVETAAGAALAVGCLLYRYPRVARARVAASSSAPPAS
ncbi:MAG: hypothetical protein QOE58_1138 [Actinomycetota bacterium]|nr:hypothetical protein [Actinomycetota bacterium]